MEVLYINFEEVYIRTIISMKQNLRIDLEVSLKPIIDIYQCFILVQ